MIAREHRTPNDRLPGGGPYYDVIGAMAYDLEEDLVQCHLCGEWFRFIGAKHLIYRHGVRLAQYRELFHLRPTTPSCSPGLSRRRSEISIANDTGAYGQAHRQQPTTDARQRVPRWRSLAASRPDLLRLWHPTRNRELDPSAIGPTSRARRLWWRCPDCGREWQAYPRTALCKRCGSTRTSQKLSVVAPERSLAAIRPDLAAELHPTANGDLDTSTLAARTGRRLWWQCPHCGHEWQRRLDRGERTPRPACVPTIRSAARTGQVARRSAAGPDRAAAPDA